MKKIDETISKIEGGFCVFVFLAMVLVVCWSVLCRYVLKIKFTQGEELTRYAMIYIVYLGTSIGVKNRSHIGIDVFVDLLNEKSRKIVKCITESFCCLLFVFLLYISFMYVGHLLRTNQMTTTTQLPVVVFYAALPIGLLFSIVHYIFEIVTMIGEIRGKGKEAC